jgi:magnesium chelatase subunit D
MTELYMNFPFAALVGQDQLKLALLLNAVYPAIGGVLIRGEKGTAKTTAARGLAELLPPLRALTGCPYHCDPGAGWTECPHCTALSERRIIEMPVPFVDLPIGATQDRVLGTLDFEKALREGRRSFQPGLLAAAHRGVLYIDEVNLLPDHLVDVLLDAAAMGKNTVQREGVSFTHPARFLLVGTMNPEEGDLRPQFLDRFGLMVSVAGPREPDVRAEVVRRRMAYEQDPAAFAERWAGEQAELRNRVEAARRLLDAVTVEDGLLTFISRLCCEFQVDGLRADLVVHRCARTLAAWNGRKAVTIDDIRQAAELALPHRRRRRPFEPPGLDQEQLQNLCANPPPPSEATTSSEPGETDSGEPTNGGAASAEKVFEPGKADQVRKVELLGAKAASWSHGRRNPAANPRQGAYVRARPDPAPTSLALDATLRAAVQRGARVEDGKLALERADLHRKEHAGRTGTTILFVVDASGSMAARKRMEAVKGAVLALLENAYQERDAVGVITFRGPEAELLLAPTTSVELAEKALRALPTGGRTPLAHALQLAHESISRERRSQTDALFLLVVLSDGKANVGLPDQPGDPWQQALRVAGELAAAGVPALVLDTDAGFVRLGKARELATALAGEHRALEELSAEAIVLNIR